MSSDVLGPGSFAAARDRLASEELDVLVVGGGITGVGTALDAVARGLRVGVVEAQDWAAGTSSRSSKLIHGGLRYLQTHDVALVREALRERAVLSRLAPHLVRPLPLLFPLRRPIVDRVYLGAGVSLYDLLARADRTARSASASFPRHLRLSRRRAIELAPGLATDHLAGAIRFFDAQVDDARYVVAVLRTAVGLGAVALSRSAVVALRREGGRIVGATVRHLEDGTTTGTTDTPWVYDTARPAATSADVSYLLKTLNGVLADPLGSDDVESAYVGIRPLIASSGSETTRLSREHAVVRPVPGFVVVSGGKYTTYRVMAADAVDAALRELGRPLAGSPTADIPPAGAGPPPPALGAGIGLNHEMARRLYGRYGANAVEVVALAEQDPALRATVGGYLVAELVYAVTHEDGRHLDDVLERRTRLAIETRDRGSAAAKVAANLIGPLLGWDAATIEREVTAYRAGVTSMERAERCASDAAATEVIAATPPLLRLP